MKRREYIVAIGASLVMLTSCGEQQVQEQQIVFMNNVKVFESFEMKKDYDVKIAEDLGSDALILDSLEQLINRGQITEIETINKLKQQFMVVNSQYEESFQELSTKYTTEVNDRLNEYIKKYSEDKGYDIILGSGGQGNVMYVKDGLDVTDDLIAFVNKQYEQ